MFRMRIFALLSLCVLASWSFAQPMGQGNPQRLQAEFESFDTNGDLVIDATEFQQQRALRMEMREKQGYPMRNKAFAPSFEELDSNGDGVIDQQEFNTNRKMRGRGFRRYSR